VSVISLGYVGIGASDVSAWRAFAGEVLGCQVNDGPDGSLLLRIDDRAWRIAVEHDPSDDIIYAGWEVAGASELDAVCARVEAAGIPVKRDRGRLAKKRGVMALAQFTDPAGVPCELFWGATVNGKQPFVSPKGVQFRTGDQGLGHIVIGTTNTEEMSKFYREILGFKLSDTIFMTIPASGFVVPITFLHCNPRHHTLAYMPNPNPRRLHHFMLETQELDDVGYALDRLEKSDGKLALTMGRHGNDLMLSFYCYSPSEFEIEYGWGARTVDETWVPVRQESISFWGHKFVGKGTPPA
jgi:2,3-dihydroxybiphenyl 1,2-dioxygenase